MMISDYAHAKITNQNARELQARAAQSRQAREIAAERTARTSIVAWMAGMLKRQTTARPARPCLASFSSACS